MALCAACAYTILLPLSASVHSYCLLHYLLLACCWAGMAGTCSSSIPSLAFIGTILLVYSLLPSPSYAESILPSSTSTAVQAFPACTLTTACIFIAAFCFAIFLPFTCIHACLPVLANKHSALVRQIHCGGICGIVSLVSLLQNFLGGRLTDSYTAHGFRALFVVWETDRRHVFWVGFSGWWWAWAGSFSSPLPDN